MGAYDLSLNPGSGKFDALGLNNPNKNRLCFLIDRECDLDNFIKNYWNGKAKQFFAIAAFRLDKIKSLNLSYKQFSDDFKIDKTKAIEKLFQLPVNQAHMKMLHRLMKEKKMTLEGLFMRHKQNPEYPFIRHLL